MHLLFFEPEVVTAGFVANELDVAKVPSHFRRDDVGGCDPLALRLRFGEQDDGASAVKPEWWPEFGVCCDEYFSVKSAVAWPGALVEDCAVFPERELVANFLKAGKLSRPKSESRFCPVYQIEPERGEACDAKAVEPGIDAGLPFLKPDPIFQGIAKA